MTKSISWNRFLGSLNAYKFGLWMKLNLKEERVGCNRQIGQEAVYQERAVCRARKKADKGRDDSRDKGGDKGRDNSWVKGGPTKSNDKITKVPYTPLTLSDQPSFALTRKICLFHWKIGGASKKLKPSRD
jgi:hypothetical protein